MWRYQLLIRLIAPLLLIWLAWEAIKRQGDWRFIFQRLGFDYRFTSRPAQPIWIHCASVGEVRLITPLIQAEPDQAWLITCNTPTGMRAAQSVSHPLLQLAYLPLDYPSAIQRFLAQAQPQALWVVETELWPNLYQTAKKAGLTIHLINGRLSAKSLRAPTWLKQAYQACFNACDSVMVRHPTDKEDFISLGAAANKIQIVGNLKLSNLQQPRHQPAPTSADYVIMASTHQGEDIALIEHWLALGRTELLVVAPRHPHHARRLFKTLQQRGLMVCLADTLPAKPPPGLVCIEHRFGQLLAWFEHAKIVIMGGSFVTKGGHNFLEAAAYGRCILTGPDNRDFAPEATLFEQESGLIICPNYEKLQQRLNQLLTNAALRERYGTRATQLIAQQPDVLTAYRLALGRIDLGR